MTQFLSLDSGRRAIIVHHLRDSVTYKALTQHGDSLRHTSRHGSATLTHLQVTFSFNKRRGVKEEFSLSTVACWDSGINCNTHTHGSRLQMEGLDVASSFTRFECSCTSVGFAFNAAVCHALHPWKTLVSPPQCYHIQIWSLHLYQQLNREE